MERPDGKLMEVASYASEWQAEAVAVALRADGIKAQVVGGMLTGFRAEVPGVLAKVIVHEADFDAARSTIAGLKTESASIDWDSLPEGTSAGRESIDWDKPEELPADVKVGIKRRARKQTVARLAVWLYLGPIVIALIGGVFFVLWSLWQRPWANP